MQRDPEQQTPITPGQPQDPMDMRKGASEHMRAYSLLVRFQPIDSF